MHTACRYRPGWRNCRIVCRCWTGKFSLTPIRCKGCPSMTTPCPPASNERRLRGQQKLAEIDGAAGQKVIDALADLAPDFANYLFEYPFGDIYSRPGLDLRAREIA